jgi:hypothetical protein
VAAQAKRKATSRVINPVMARGDFSTARKGLIDAKRIIINTVGIVSFEEGSLSSINGTIAIE